MRKNYIAPIEHIDNWVCFLFEKKCMKRHLQNLQRLYQKLQARYGVDDVLVMQLKREIETIESNESRHRARWRHPRLQQERRESYLPLQ